jgi:5-dehydro-2-deoxygluconokinase
MTIVEGDVPPRPVGERVQREVLHGRSLSVGLVDGLLGGRPPARIVEYANAAGAIVAGRLLYADAMPTDNEIMEMLQHSEEPS